MENQSLKQAEIYGRNRFTSVLSTLSKWGCVVSAVALFAMMMSTTIDILGRSLFNAPLRGDYELVGLLLIVAGTFGLGWCQITKSHIRVTLFYDMASRKGKGLLNILAYFCTIVVAGIVFWEVLMLALYYLAMPKGTNVTQILEWPFFPFLLMLSLGFGWWCLIAAVDLYNSIKGGIKK